MSYRMLNYIPSKKERICSEGVDVPYLYYLISGKAKIYMSHKNGRVSLINFIQAPSFIGELGLIGVESVTKTVEVIEDCICLALPLKDCQHLLLQDATFLQKLCKFIGEKTITRTESYAKNNSYPFENRLAAFILLTEQNNSYTEKHTEASEYLNVSYRHLLYVLNQFCQQNYLKKTAEPITYKTEFNWKNWLTNLKYKKVALTFIC